jgi:hypothetical protein
VTTLRRHLLHPLVSKGFIRSNLFHGGAYFSTSTLPNVALTQSTSSSSAGAANASSIANTSSTPYPLAIVTNHRQGSYRIGVDDDLFGRHFGVLLEERGSDR